MNNIQIIQVNLQPIAPQFESPPNTKFHSPTKREMKRSQELLLKVMLPKLMNQERSHAIGKRPQIRCAVEADIKIQQVLSATSIVKSRFLGLEDQFNKLERGVDKLELELENGQKHHLIHQLSFFPGTGLSPPLTPNPRERRTTPHRQAKMRVLSSRNVNGDASASSSSVMSSLSPASPSYLMTSPMIEYTRKRNALEMSLSRLLLNLKGETQVLQGMFKADFKVLKFKRAEKCVLNMIKLQRKLKGFEDSVCQLRDRLLHIGES